ncbi:MAG: phosphate acyltransferase PlsX [Blastocatellia bacterium]|nr:phosphate acyltransferase PlsX [Blastocatellia bacterium]MCS7157657.1 phosphate acyltransferase PlsX [Blastocatellia bacterium]MCX7751922.1 phosphate acyltransferase PlsX [Blastocatellia bacterium]MDW8167028.1 phosphate acyltransferase PlsX [Acidobacteriota bacterium]MDW8257132.1 phosphate acyltransferase PlsX [Acidobacteriota bacterium]
MLRIALDAMGSDRAPEPEVEGAVCAAREQDLTIVLVGPEAALRERVRRQGADARIEIVNASEVITPDEPVAQAIRKKRDSTIHVGLRLVHEGYAHAFVSAGNTGAIMAAAKMILKTLGSIDRPALAAVLPTFAGKRAVLIDVGANAECRPSHLVQFAIMGDIYARLILGIASPRIGLVSIGEEEAKGNELTREAYKQLERSGLHFVGNVEGQHIYMGDVDVIVCDGFTGNVILKTSEGVFDLLRAALQQELRRTFRTRLGAWLARQAFERFRRRFDYFESGGAPLLGVRQVCLICHGRSDSRAIKNAIRIAKELVERRAPEQIEREIARVQEADGERIEAKS